MNQFIIGFLMGLFITACAGTVLVLKESERTYWPCEEGQGKVGEMCWAYCAKTHWLTGKCTEQKIDVKNLCDKETFNWFKSGNWRMITEERLLRK